MTRYLLSFLAGTMLAAAGVVLADYRTGVMFVAGGICTLILQAALVLNLRRARALARFIDGVCNSMAQTRRASQRSSVLEGAPLPEGARPEPQVDPQAVTDLASALRNMGMDKNKAKQTAMEAAAGGGTLPDMIRRATSRLNASARVN